MRLVKKMMVLVAALAITPALAQDNMQILRDKIKADKKFVVAVNMGLSESEATGFWPVYDGYQRDLQKVNERVVNLIVSYADAYNKGPVPDETAKKLLGELIAVEEDELKLKRDYVPKLEAVLPGSKVARYMQIENKIRAVVKYGLAEQVPLVVGPAVAAAAPAGKQIIVYFDTDSSKLRPDSQKAVMEAIEAAKARGVTQVSISGYADTSGPEGYNMKLGEMRAEAVAAEMKKAGISDNLVKVGSLGQTDLAVPTPDETNEARNRRVVITIK